MGNSRQNVVSSSEIKALGGLESWIEKNIQPPCRQSSKRKTAQDSICGPNFFKMTQSTQNEKNELKTGKERKIRAYEHDEQVELLRMCRMNEQKYPGLELIFAIPNGGQRHPAVAAKLKAEGVRAGVPDLFLPVPCGNTHGLFIELKTLGGVVSENQRRMLFALIEQGYAAVVAYGWEQAWALIQKYLGPEAVA